MFSHRWMRAGLFALAALTGSALAGPGNSVLFSDNFDDGDDLGWVQVDLIGGTTFDASSGSYAIDTIPLPPLPFNVGSGSFVAASIENPDFRNCTMRATVRFNNADTNAILIGRGSAETPGAHYYGFVLDNARPAPGGNYIDIFRVDADVDSGVELAFEPFEFTEGVDYVLDARMTGDTLTLKAWRADELEPAEPQIVAADSTYKSQTVCGLAVFNENELSGGAGGALSATFDDVVVTRGGKPGAS